MKKYKLWIGFYESMSNYQICLMSNKPVSVAPDKLVRFLRWLGFHNASKITFIGQSKNEYIGHRDIKYDLYGTFLETEEEQ